MKILSENSRQKNAHRLHFEICEQNYIGCTCGVLSTLMYKNTLFYKVS